uniref:CARD domain-containing protein n=1 Tax=Gopherus agassizii TaxID=38772 RepID=A0A452HDB6_9SAUR
MAVSCQADTELRDLDEEQLWEILESHRYRIVRSTCPNRLTPYLHQAKVLDQLDEEEVLHGPQFTNSAMRVGHMLDLLKTRGKNGALAFLESLKLHNPDTYTLITGLEPSIDLSNFSGKSAPAGMLGSRVNPGRSVAGMMQLSVTLGTCALLVLWQLYLMKQELQRARVESYCERERSLRMPSDLQPQADELLQLREENEKLQSLVVLETFSLVQKDILEQNLDEALEGKQELLDRIHSLREQAVIAENQRKKYWEEKEHTLIECHKMKVDCEIYKEKISALQGQVAELQKERDQAYGARDTAQLEISQNLLEKDSLCRKVFELTDQICELRKQASQQQAELGSRVHGVRGWGLGTAPVKSSCSCLCSDFSVRTSHELPESFRSCSPIPPCKLSLQRRATQECLESSLSTRYFPISSSLCRAWGGAGWRRGCMELALFPLPHMKCLLSTPICRRAARRILSRITTIAFHGNALLEQISIIGGNQTGIFIHGVTPGSVADEMSLSPGSQIMVDYEVTDPAFKAILEDATLEEALWVLKRVNGFCCLSVRMNVEGYKRLVTDLENKVVTSGDSFYIRANLALEGKAAGELPVQCSDILHVTDTVFQGKSQWSACQVNPYSMKDMDAGIVPNHYQPLLSHLQVSGGQPKLVRIISTDKSKINPLWSSIDCNVYDPNQADGICLQAGSCFTLMPYTLVRPHKLAQLRPVLFVPMLLGKILSDKLCLSKGFEKCPSGTLVRGKRELDSRCCVTCQVLQLLLEKDVHSLLDMGLECVRALHAAGIYPILLLVSISEKSAKKLKKALQRLGATEEQLLDCVRREEAQLEKVPCLYGTVAPDTWSDLDTLVGAVRAAVANEQKKIVWLEQDLH